MLLHELYDMNDPYLARRKERTYRAEEEERLNDEIRKSFLNDKTSIEDFDIDVVEKIITMAVNKKPALKRQGEEMLQTWKTKLSENTFLDNDIFNKLFKQFEQLKDSSEAPIIQFNKLYSLTKELESSAENFEDWKNSDAAQEIKWKSKQTK